MESGVVGEDHAGEEALGEQRLESVVLGTARTFDQSAPAGDVEAALRTQALKRPLAFEPTVETAPPAIAPWRGREQQGDAVAMRQAVGDEGALRTAGDDQGEFSEIVEGALQGDAADAELGHHVQSWDTGRGRRQGGPNRCGPRSGACAS